MGSLQHLESVAFDAADKERVGRVQRHHEALKRVLELGADRLGFFHVLVDNEEALAADRLVAAGRRDCDCGCAGRRHGQLFVGRGNVGRGCG